MFNMITVFFLLYTVCIKHYSVRLQKILAWLKEIEITLDFHSRWCFIVQSGTAVCASEGCHSVCEWPMCVGIELGHCQSPQEPFW